MGPIGRSGQAAQAERGNGFTALLGRNAMGSRGHQPELTQVAQSCNPRCFENPASHSANLMTTVTTVDMYT